MKRMTSLLLATAATSGALILGGTAPAFAAESAHAPDTGSCWVQVDTNESLCVDEGVDLVAAVAKEKGVRIVAEDGAIIAGKPYKASNVSAFDVGTQASYVVGILYDDVDYGGGSFVMSVTSSAGCTTGTAYGYTSLVGWGWNDRASSFHSYIGCKSAVFENTSYIGSQYGYYINASRFGVMNDKASSWRVAP
ncbi:hypothetical protein [Agromyces sp. NPDC055658]